MWNSDIVPGFDDDRDESLEVRLQIIENIDGCLVLYLKGQLDEANSSNFKRRVGEAIEAGFIRLIFHCRGLDWVSDTTKGAFASFVEAVKPGGGDVVLTEIAPPMYRSFELFGFSQLFTIKESLDEAVSFFVTEGEVAKGITFPRIIVCPVCHMKLTASRSCRFRCSACRTILAIDTTGLVFRG
jgi:anti-sigma B factor antagonist